MTSPAPRCQHHHRRYRCRIRSRPRRRRCRCPHRRQKSCLYGCCPRPGREAPARRAHSTRPRSRSESPTHSMIRPVCCRGWAHPLCCRPRLSCCPIRSSSPPTRAYVTSAVTAPGNGPPSGSTCRSCTGSRRRCRCISKRTLPTCCPESIWFNTKEPIRFHIAQERC